MTERAETSTTQWSGQAGGKRPWHREADGTFKGIAGRPGRPRAKLPARTVEGERPSGKPLRRRGAKAPEVPVYLRPADPAEGLWTRKAPSTNNPPELRRRRVVLSTREMLSGPPARKWIGITHAFVRSEESPILAIERWIFGEPDVAASSWKRSEAKAEAREWPLPPDRPKAEVKGRPLPRRKVITPLSGRRR